ncbi:MAG: RodZ domain-containing protein [Cyanobacteria bacterium P01_C01_bin.89]
MTQDSPNIDSSPQDPLEVIGAELRQKREQQGISLEAIAAQTKVQRRILVAIEEADWSSLPEPVYIRGFVSRYGDALGLDGKNLAGQIPTSPVVQTPTRPKSDFQPAAQLRPSHLYGIYVVLIAAAVWGLSLVLQRSGEQRPSVPVSGTSGSSEVSPSPAPPSSPTPAATPVEATVSPSPESSPENDGLENERSEGSGEPEGDAESSASSNGSPDAPSDGGSSSPVENSTGDSDDSTESVDSAPEDSEEEPSLVVQGWLAAVEFPDRQIVLANSKAVNVNVQLTSRAWIRVVVDGQVDFEGVLPEGTERSWAADESLLVRSGNAGAVLLSFNGQNPQPLGEKGAVQETRFEAEDSPSL